MSEEVEGTEVDGKRKSTITFTLPVDLEHVEIEVIKFTIAYYHGDKKAAASALGISLKTVYNKLEKEQERENAANRNRVPKNASR